jgi:thiol-disulfide isomerase/thioredoxin
MNSNQAPYNKGRHFWTPMRIALTVIVLSLIAIGGFSSCTSSDEKPDRAATTPPTKAPRKTVPAGPPTAEAPTSLSADVLGARLQTVGGGTISLRDFSGKVMLVNLWATWCGPCRSEIPELVKIHKEFQSQGFEIVGLSTENPTSSAESVKEFVQSFQMDYQVGWASRDVVISFFQMSQRDAIPQSFIISRDGRVLKQFVGFNPTGTPPLIRQAIEEALKG